MKRELGNSIVISDENLFEEESKSINELFEEGLEIFHLRKPNATEAQIKELILKINPENRNKIALHSHHDLAGELGISRLHFSEKSRNEFVRKSGFIYSTSFHDVEAAQREGGAFDYYFLSPIFDSLSKMGYYGKKFYCPSWKAVALGGVCLDNLEEAKSLGYKNIALLGSIWEEPKMALKRFVQVREKWGQLHGHQELSAKNQSLKTNNSKLKILTIAGFDPSGGAGILRDAAVIRDFNMDCLGVLTCNTIQNENRFESIHWLSQKELEAQIDILKDEKVAVVKVGLTKNLEMIQFTLNKVKANFPKAKIVLDPILKTSTGFSMDHDTAGWMEIIKQGDVLTPNWEEMEKISDSKEIEKTALKWSRYATICLKGGHSPHPEKDLLFNNGEKKEIIGRKEKLNSRHGSGCVYSTVFACAMANGREIEEAAKVAKNKTEEYLTEGFFGGAAKSRALAKLPQNDENNKTSSL